MPIVIEPIELTVEANETNWQNESPKTEFVTVLPTKSQVLAAIPEDCFERSLVKSSIYMVASLSMTLACGFAAYFLLPISWAWLPAWIGYAIVTGTVATGCWWSPTSVATVRIVAKTGSRIRSAHSV